MKVAAAEKNRRMEAFSRKCREKKFPLTPQKTAIFEFLASTKNHPTAEEIFSEIQKQFPTLSVATVYKNLQKFVSLRIVQEIKSKDRKSHFDARMDTHHHIILRDGSIRDVDIDTSKIPLPNGISFDDISKISVKFYIN